MRLRFYAAWLNSMNYRLKLKTISKRRHVPTSVGAINVCKPRLEFGSPPFLYTGIGCIEMFMNYLNDEVHRARTIYERVYVPCAMTVDALEKFRSTHECEMCHRNFDTVPSLRKVRDHCHLTGRYRYALCAECNLTQAKRPFEVYVFFHGLSNYDSHFLIQKLNAFPGYSLNVIPRNSEKYLTFSLGPIKFKDSYGFLQCSLSTLMTNLASEGERHFRYLKKYVPESDLREMLLRKGVFPYSYFSSLSILKNTELPPITSFRNDLDGKAISQSDYDHAQRVWKAFRCRSFVDYLHVYLLCESIGNYDFDPTHYFSGPHYCYNAFLRMSGVQMDLLTDINQYFFLKKGIRGGLSMVVKRYSKANNPNLSGYVSSAPHVYILDLDANNLYGKAMLEALPYSGFRWMGREELTQERIMGMSPTGEDGCFVECTLDYPKALHEWHSDYPLAPEKVKVTYEKLSPYAKFLCDQHKIEEISQYLEITHYI